MELNADYHKDIGNFKYIDRDTISTPFFTEKYCKNIIDYFEKVGFKVDQVGNYDTLINQGPNGKKLCTSFINTTKRFIEPEILKVYTAAIKNRLWSGYPVPFIKKFSSSGQKDLKLHTDNSLLTLFVKMNVDYEGCDTIFPRQNWSLKQLPVGHMVLFPGVVTHPHYTTELISGIKYSLIARVSILQPRVNEFDDISKVINEY